MITPAPPDALVTTACRGCKATLLVPLTLFDTRTCVTCRDLTGDWCPWMARLLRLLTPERAAALLADATPRAGHVSRGHPQPPEVR